MMYSLISVQYFSKGPIPPLVNNNYNYYFHHNINKDNFLLLQVNITNIIQDNNNPSLVDIIKDNFIISSEYYNCKALNVILKEMVFDKMVVISMMNCLVFNFNNIMATFNRIADCTFYKSFTSLYIN